MTRASRWLLAAVLLLLAGCTGPDLQEQVDGAADALEAAGTARFEMSVVAAGLGPDRFSAHGAQDLASGALQMRIDLGDDTPETETLLLGDEVFLRSPLFELFTGDPDLWVRVDLTAAAAQEGFDDGLVEGNTGPAALLAQLEGATDEATELGREDVREVATTHVRVTVDTDAAIERSAPEAREQLRAYAEATGLPATYPLELWIDDDGLVRRIRTVLDVPVGGEGEQGGDAAEEGAAVTQETVLELYDFGVSVDLQRPAQDRTVDLAELLDQLETLETFDGS